MTDTESLTQAIKRIGEKDRRAAPVLMQEFYTLASTSGKETSTPEGMKSFLDRVSSESGASKEQVMELIEKWCVSHV